MNLCVHLCLILNYNLGSLSGRKEQHMCGIVGIASLNLNKIKLNEITNTLSHRGPDDFGIYQDNYVGLGHRRLSIIDLEGGRQPIFNEDRSMCIIFNGEIYNFIQIRDDFLEKVIVFQHAAIQRLFYMLTKNGEKNALTTFGACSPLQSGIQRPGGYFLQETGLV